MKIESPITFSLYKSSSGFFISPGLYLKCFTVSTTETLFHNTEWKVAIAWSVQWYTHSITEAGILNWTERTSFKGDETSTAACDIDTTKGFIKSKAVVLFLGALLTLWLPRRIWLDQENF